MSLLYALSRALARVFSPIFEIFFALRKENPRGSAARVFQQFILLVEKSLNA